MSWLEKTLLLIMGTTIIGSWFGWGILAWVCEGLGICPANMDERYGLAWFIGPYALGGAAGFAVSLKWIK